MWSHRCANTLGSGTGSIDPCLEGTFNPSARPRNTLSSQVDPSVINSSLEMALVQIPFTAREETQCTFCISAKGAFQVKSKDFPSI